MSIWDPPTGPESIFQLAELSALSAPALEPNSGWCVKAPGLVMMSWSQGAISQLLLSMSSPVDSDQMHRFKVQPEPLLCNCKDRSRRLSRYCIKKVLWYSDTYTIHIRPNTTISGSKCMHHEWTKQVIGSYQTVPPVLVLLSSNTQARSHKTFKQNLFQKNPKIKHGS